MTTAVFKTWCEVKQSGKRSVQIQEENKLTAICFMLLDDD